MDWILQKEINNTPSSSKIFSNEQYLSLNYIPNNVPFREDKIKNLFNYFKPIFSNTENNYTFIPSILVLGEPGTGKSLVIRRFGIELQKLIEQKKPSYVFEVSFLIFQIEVFLHLKSFECFKTCCYKQILIF